MTKTRAEKWEMAYYGQAIEFMKNYLDKMTKEQLLERIETLEKEAEEMLQSAVGEDDYTQISLKENAMWWRNEASYIRQNYKI